jgi:hypothetical protein
MRVKSWLVCGGGCRLFEESSHGRSPLERWRKRLDNVKTYEYVRQINWDCGRQANVSYGAFRYQRVSLSNYCCFIFLGAFQCFEDSELSGR